MKLAFISNSGWNISNFRKELLIFFIEKKYSVTLICPEDDHIQELTNLGCKHININIKKNHISPINDLILFFKIILILNKIKPKYLLSFTIKPNIFASLTAYFLNIKVICNISGLGTTFLKSKLLKSLTIFLYKISLRRSYHIFFQNIHDQNLFKNNKILKNKNYSIIPGSGIDLDKYKTKIVKKNTKFKFLFVGRLLIDKGLNEFLKSAEIIKKKYKNIDFVILGKLDQNNPRSVNKIMFDKFKKKEIIKYIGFKNNVIPYIIDSDCVVLPSYREGLSRSLLEAASLSKPLIASNVPGCEELIEESVNGFLCEAKNYISLAESMEKIINLNPNKIIQMGKESRKLVEKKYSINKIIHSYEEFIN